jgi:DNA invertase Pin-like site-specific DNA recombinase
MTQHDQTTYSQPLQPPLLPLTGRVAIYAREAPSAAIAVFIQTCIEHGILLVTPTMTYNFSTPAHVAQFRFRETASQYVQQVIASRLQAGKKQKREQKTQKDGQ